MQINKILNQSGDFDTRLTDMISFTGSILKDTTSSSVVIDTERLRSMEELFVEALSVLRKSEALQGETKARKYPFRYYYNADLPSSVSSSDNRRSKKRKSKKRK